MRVPDFAPGPGGLSFRRDIVLRAAHSLKSLGHAKLDHVLLEWNLPDLRQSGSLEARANSLAQYALDYPERRTAAGERVDVAIVLRAANLIEELAAVQAVLHGELGDLRFHLEHEGFGFGKKLTATSARADAVKVSDRITLADGLEILKRRMSADQAKSLIRKAFAQKAFAQSPLYALSYDEAEIGWRTGLVKIPRLKDKFSPTFLRGDFDAYFSETTMPPRTVPLPTLTTARAEAAKALQARIELGKELQEQGKDTFDDQVSYKKAAKRWREYNITFLTGLFTDDSVAQEYKSDGFSVAPLDNPEVFPLFVNEIESNIETLESILYRLDLYSEPPIAQAGKSPSLSSKVFVVHGHDDGARDGVARFLERIGLEAIILVEQPNMGRTIIEKFIDYAEVVGFAVVLVTPDDLGGAAATPVQSARARQNVIFELGYFVGSLGRGKACLLRKGEVEMPSDLYGVVYTTMDRAGAWKMELARELKAAGFEFDAARALA